MTMLLCRNKVEDFGQWKKVFDSHSKAQRESGLRIKNVWQNIEDANEVFMLFDVDDLAKAKGFIYSAEVPHAQKAAGMAVKPEMYFIR